MFLKKYKVKNGRLGRLRLFVSKAMYSGKTKRYLLKRRLIPALQIKGRFSLLIHHY